MGQREQQGGERAVIWENAKEKALNQLKAKDWNLEGQNDLFQNWRQN